MHLPNEDQTSTVHQKPILLNHTHLQRSDVSSWFLNVTIVSPGHQIPPGDP